MSSHQTFALYDNGTTRDIDKAYNFIIYLTINKLLPREFVRKTEPTWFHELSCNRVLLAAAGVIREAGGMKKKICGGREWFVTLYEYAQLRYPVRRVGLEIL